MTLVDCPTPDKRAYKHHRDARRAMKHIQTHGLPVKSVYRCTCGAFHLTSERVTATAWAVA